MTNAPAPLGSHFRENLQTLATRHKPSSQPPSDEPDLSHLTPEERRIIEDVLNRQKQEEIKDAELIKKTSTVVSTTPSRSSVPPTSAQSVPASTSGGTATVVSKQSAAALPHNGGVNNPPKSTSGLAAALTGAFNAVTAEPAFEGLLDNVCQICRKTKFADGLGHACTNCRRKTCTRCGYQMNTDVNQVKWTCKECAQSNPSGQTNPTQSQLPAQTTSGSAVSGQKTAGRFASGLLDLFGGQKPAIPSPDQKQSLHTDKKRQLPQIGSVDRRSAREFDYSAPNLVPPSAGRVMPHLPPSRRLSSAEEYGTISNERYANSELRDPEQGYYSQQYERPYYGEQFQRSGYQSSPRTARYGRRSGASDRRYPGYPNVNTSRLDPYYYADSLTSDRSESPARSMGGWSSSGYRRPSPAPMAYIGRSDSEYDAERYQYSTQAYPPRSLRPRRYHSPSLVEGGYPEYEMDRQEYKFSPIPPSYGMDSSAAPPEFQSPSFSSSEADEVGGIRSDEMVYPEDEVITTSTSRKRRNLPDYYSDSPRSAATTFEGEYLSRNAPTIQRPVEEYAYSDPSQLDRKSEHPMSRRFLTPIQAYDSDNLEEFSDQGPVVEEYEGGLTSGDGMPYLNTEQRPRRIPPEIVQSRTSQSATWNPSADGKRLISRMILRKRTDLGLGDGGTILGLKISGGRPTPSGVLGAFITRIKDGSLADVVGQLKPGDEVLEWNGHPLRNLSAEEVSDVLYRTKDALEVELLVQRNRKERQGTSEEEFQSQIGPPELQMPARKNQRQLPDSSWNEPDQPQCPSVQLKLLFEYDRNQMTVHLISACWLTPNYYNAPDAVCNTYCRIRLLPGQNESTMKYSKLITRTNNPRWNQLFIFSNYSENEIAQHDLELTVWNCGLNTNEQTLLGEVIIDLSVADLTGETYWYPLQLGNHPDYSSEAPTPVVGSLTKYDMPPQFDSDRSSVSAPVDNRPVFDRPKIHQSELTEREDLKYAGSAAQKSGDYSDIDERRFGSGSVYAPIRGLNRVEQLRSSEDHRRPSAQTNARTRHSEYGPDDHASHSDFSEFSDVSETSRISSRTGQSERERRRPSNQSSSYSTHHRSSRPEITGTRRIPDMSRLSEEEVDGAGDKSNFSGRSGGQEISANLQQQAAKESSSSETGSGLIKSAPESGTDQTAKSSTALGTSQSSSQPDSHSRRGEPRRGRPSIGHKFSTVLGRSHKSSSTSTLDKKTKSSFQRSEEVLPSSTSGFYADDSSESRMHHQMSLSSGRTDNISNNDGTDQDSRASPSLMRNDLHVGEFVEGLGPGQLVGRQVLGMPCLGEIQLSFLDRRGRLEVEVIRARGLQHKNSSKPLPAPYVKLHLLEGKQSVEKLRTTAPPRRTLDPLYQQQLTFSVPYHGKIMQVSVWGEYGRMDKKVFLGMCEIVLDDLDLKSVVFGWYKLFGMIAASAHHQPPYGTTGPHTEDRTNPDEEKQQRPGSKSKGEKVSPRSRGKSVSGRPKPRNSVSGNGSVRTRTKSVGDRASGPRKSVSRDSKRSASSAHQTRETAQR